MHVCEGGDSVALNPILLSIYPMRIQTFLSFGVLFATGASVLTGCLPEPAFPNEPEIALVSFDLQLNGSRELIIQFSDGDGDLGLSQGDTVPPFCATCEFHQNLHCDYQEWRNEEWFEITLDPNAGQIPFYYRVPVAEPTGQNPALNGTISVDMPTWHLSSIYDSVRFRITLFDRSLNASNEIFTPALLKP
tara:strand:- start:4891 stop:5463 length:573 start_codon:yes stop_codon:yes gene_type:complete